MYYVTMDIKEIAKTAKKRLIHLGITQTDLAKEVGTTPQKVNQFLLGGQVYLSAIDLRILDHLGLELIVREKK